MVLTLRLSVVYGSQKKKQHIIPYITFTECFCIAEAESVYYAVHIESLYEKDTFRLEK